MEAQPDNLPDLAAELTRALGEAHASITAGDFGEDLVELLRRARELHEALLEGLLTAEPDVPEAVHGLAVTLGNNLDRLEAALRAGQGNA